MPKIICYGSLRKTSARGYNYQRFGKGQQYVKDLTLKGWDLFSLGSYPCVAPGAGTIKAELHEIDDAGFRSVANMERGAGYAEREVELDDGQKATIFFMPAERINPRLEKVESGDWS